MFILHSEYTSNIGWQQTFAHHSHLGIHLDTCFHSHHSRKRKYDKSVTRDLKASSHRWHRSLLLLLPSQRKPPLTSRGWEWNPTMCLEGEPEVFDENSRENPRRQDSGSTTLSQNIKLNVSYRMKKGEVRIVPAHLQKKKTEVWEGWVCIQSW